MNVEIYDILKEIFNKNGFSLWMIGSLSRDFLLNKEIKDYDFVTNAKPEEVKKFLDVDMTFSRFGAMKYKINGVNVDIVTLRKEKMYLDYRHPAKIEFINDINIDYLRRDFTINAIYINEKYEIEKISEKGKDDLFNKRLEFIGDPLTRIKEDPLRILRAKRFIYEYNLKVDDKVLQILKVNVYLLKNLNENKVKEENKKFNFVMESKNEKII